MTRGDPFRRFSLTKKSQLTTKSDQWFDDARFLHQSARYAAALYLGGFVIECLLKAALWERRQEPDVRRLLYSHELDDLLAALPVLAREMERDPVGVQEEFVQICNWNVRIRYNPLRVDKRDCDDFVRRLTEVRTWLRDRV
ncbi:MAG TPA: HEPN domain-containing protein [Phycisphaerae bacterium]|nr:HEPN domain-containing protein [Phycisphaerae bacterium]